MFWSYKIDLLNNFVLINNNYIIQKCKIIVTGSRCICIGLHQEFYFIHSSIDKKKKTSLTCNQSALYSFHKTTYVVFKICQFWYPTYVVILIAKFTWYLQDMGLCSCNWVNQLSDFWHNDMKEVLLRKDLYYFIDKNATSSICCHSFCKVHINICSPWTL